MIMSDNVKKMLKSTFADKPSTVSSWLILSLPRSLAEKSSRANRISYSAMKLAVNLL